MSNSRSGLETAPKVPSLRNTLMRLGSGARNAAARFTSLYGRRSTSNQSRIERATRPKRCVAEASKRRDARNSHFRKPVADERIISASRKAADRQERRDSPGGLATITQRFNQTGLDLATLPSGWLRS